jgi:hypothetical protein
MTEQEQIKYELAKKRVKKIKDFYIHLLVYLIINTYIIIQRSQGRSADDFFTFSTFSTAFFWGIGLTFHALNVFAKDIMFGRNWEEKKIKEYMDEEKKKGWE